MAATSTKVVAILDELISTCKDGETGYRSAKEDVDREDLKELFGSLGEQRAQLVADLQAVGHPQEDVVDRGGTLAAKVHRGRMNLKAAVRHGDPRTILREIDRGECAALRHHEEALQQAMPPEVHALLERHYGHLRVTYGRIRALQRTANAV
jgi:uncharacterized protein (TIGR02284 family)